MLKRFYFAISLLMAIVFLSCGCSGLTINLGPDSKKTLKQFTLQGREKGKVLIIPIRGFLSDAPQKGLLSDRGSVVQEVVSQLRLAEKDKEVKAVLLEINSAGGTITASDILYHEIMDFKERTKTKVVAVLMDVAASGGYYIALPADRIVAHPTTITGSVGVILVTPKVSGLMDKLGLAVEINKSGKEKDIGSFFRPSTPEEKKIFQELTDKMGGRFLDLVTRRRKIDPEAKAGISTARIYLAEEARQLKLIDRIGYLDDAISEAKGLASLSPEAKVVVYRRNKYPNDNPYNPSFSWSGGPGVPLMEANLREFIPSLTPGLYYLWTPGSVGN